MSTNTCNVSSSHVTEKKPRLLIYEISNLGGGRGAGQDPKAGPPGEVRGRVFRWFSGLMAAFGLGPTTVYWF